MLCPIGLINHANLSSVENVGGFEPMGSESEEHNMSISHLNNGTGNPWAGHIRA